MIRWSALLCAACGAAGSPPSPPTAAPPSSVAARPAPAPTPTDHMLARVEYQRTNAWDEVAIDGTDALARDACEALVRRLERRRIADLKIVVARGCEPTRLPDNGRGKGYVIADRHPLDPLELTELDVRAPIDGTTTHTLWYPTAAACEHARDQMVAEAARSRVEAAGAVHDFLAKQIAEAEARVKAACDPADARTCKRDDAACKLGRDERARACTQQREMADVIRRHADAAPEPPPAAPPCVAQR